MSTAASAGRTRSNSPTPTATLTVPAPVVATSAGIAASVRNAVPNVRTGVPAASSAPKVRLRSNTDPAVAIAALHPLSTAAATSPSTVTRRRSASVVRWSATRARMLSTPAAPAAPVSAVRATSRSPGPGFSTTWAAWSAAVSGSTSGCTRAGTRIPRVSGRSYTGVSGSSGTVACPSCSTGPPGPLPPAGRSARIPTAAGSRSPGALTPGARPAHVPTSTRNTCRAPAQSSTKASHLRVPSSNSTTGTVSARPSEPERRNVSPASAAISSASSTDRVEVYSAEAANGDDEPISAPADASRVSAIEPVNTASTTPADAR